jgi:hypothetical protein
MLATIRDVINTSLVEIGVLDAGSTPSAREASDALAAANRLIDQWQAEGMVLHSVTRTTWVVVSGTGLYTIGAGATIDIARPVHIDTVAFNDTTTSPETEYPLSEMTDAAWQGVAQKDLTAVWPTHWYYNPTYPFGTIMLWPIPTSATIEGVLYAKAALAAFDTLDSSALLPPAYERMLVKALGLELGPSYGRTRNPELHAQAVEAQRVVYNSNSRTLIMSHDCGALPQGGGGFDIYTGE